MIIKIIRKIVGRFLLFLNELTWPKPTQRSSDEQASIDQKAKSLVLYQYEACPFCIKVRRHLRRLNLNIEIRDAKNDLKFKTELISGGGQDQVPCLRVTSHLGTSQVQWLYESTEINKFLDQFVI